MKQYIPSWIGIVAVLVTAFFSFGAISRGIVAPQETAIVQNVVASSSPMPLPPPPPAIAITPGLLPQVKLLSKKPPAKAPVAAAIPKSAALAKKPAPISSAPPVTAQSFWDATKMSLQERLDGPYQAIFTTNAGAGGNIAWNLGVTTIGGTGSIPRFSVSYSCDPPVNLPPPDASDQNPTFNVRTPYACTIGLIPAAGNDRRSVSKQFSFTTGAGQFIITPPHAMGTVLQSGENDGGFVFNNEDANAVTVTGLTVDISYTGLNVAAGPLILRTIDPVNGVPFGDYHLENLAEDPAIPYTRTGMNIEIPVSFTVGPINQKMLPLQILDANTMRISGIDPTMTITLRGVAANQTSDGGKIVLNTAKISWSCIVPVGAYDPNATSGPYVTGEACK